MRCLKLLPRFPISLAITNDHNLPKGVLVNVECNYSDGARTTVQDVYIPFKEMKNVYQKYLKHTQLLVPFTAFWRVLPQPDKLEFIAVVLQRRKQAAVRRIAHNLAAGTPTSVKDILKK